MGNLERSCVGRHQDFGGLGKRVSNGRLHSVITK